MRYPVPPLLEERLRALRERPIEPAEKGFGSLAAEGPVTAATLVDPGASLAPGDLVALGISHPCTTLDKWRVLVVVNDDEEVTDAVHAFF